MIKAILLNDTSNELHHGCDLVIKNLYKLLKIREIKVIYSLPCGINWKENKSFYKYFNLTDIVIVNGEGTIHHDQPTGHNLLKVGEFCKKRNKKVFLINATYQNNSEYIQKYLKFFDLISVREIFSYNELKKFKINSYMVADLSFYSDHNLIKTDKLNKKIYSDSINLNITNQLYEYYKNDLNYEYLPILKRIKYNKLNFYDFLRFLKYKFILMLFKIKKNKRLNFYNSRYYGVENNEEYINKILNSEFVVTGRFHTVCICILTKTPFIAFSSNSHKIESLVKTIDINSIRVVDFSNFFKNNYKLENYSKLELEKIDNFIKETKKNINKLFDKILEISKVDLN